MHRKLVEEEFPENKNENSQKTKTRIVDEQDITVLAADKVKNCVERQPRHAAALLPYIQIFDVGNTKPSPYLILMETKSSKSTVLTCAIATRCCGRLQHLDLPYDYVTA